MKNYFIISKKNIQQLVLEVNEYIKSGSKCLGSPFQDNEKNFNQAMLSEALIMNEESQNLNTSNLSETFEYFVMIKFKLQKDAEIKFYNELLDKCLLEVKTVY